MKVLTFGCLHYPRNKESFERSLSKVDKVDLIFLSGDIAESLDGYLEVYDKIKDLSKNIIAIFGNIERNKEKIMEECEKIKFLDDSVTIFQKKYYIIGTTGSCNDFKDQNLHNQRLRFLESKLKRKENYYTIVLMHYVPSFKLLGDLEKKLAEKMGSDKYEIIISQNKPNLVIYAHSHKSLTLQTINGIPFVNSSFYANEGLLSLNLW